MSSSTIGDRTIVDGLFDTGISDALTDLALDLRWSFNHSADRLWQQLDPELWELTHSQVMRRRKRVAQGLGGGKSIKVLLKYADLLYLIRCLTKVPRWI